MIGLDSWGRQVAILTPSEESARLVFRAISCGFDTEHLSDDWHIQAFISFECPTGRSHAECGIGQSFLCQLDCDVLWMSFDTVMDVLCVEMDEAFSGY